MVSSQAWVQIPTNVTTWSKMLILFFIKIGILERGNVFSFMLMRKDSNMYLKLRGQSNKLDDNIHTAGERVTNTSYLR